MYQWQRFLAVNQALNKYRTFAPAKQAYVSLELLSMLLLGLVYSPRSLIMPA